MYSENKNFLFVYLTKILNYFTCICIFFVPQTFPPIGSHLLFCTIKIIHMYLKPNKGWNCWNTAPVEWALSRGILGKQDKINMK